MWPRLKRVKQSIQKPRKVYDSLNIANLACSLSDECNLIGQNESGNFELFTATSDEHSNVDLGSYRTLIPNDLSRPNLQPSANLIYGKRFHVAFFQSFSISKLILI